MKHLLIFVALLLLPVLNAHRLLGSWSASTGEKIPIENHLSGNDLVKLENAVDHANTKHCQDSRCEKGLMTVFYRICASVLEHFE